MEKTTTTTTPLTVFHYEGINKSGQKMVGDIQARSMAIAKADLRKQGIVTNAACRLFLRNLPGHPSPRQGQKQATSMPPAALAVLVPLDFDPPSGLKIYAPQ